MLIASIILIGVLLLDQVTKHLIVVNLAYGESLALVPDFIAIKHLHNFGAAFGLFAGQRWLFILAVVVTMIVVVAWRKDILRAGPLAVHSCGLLMGGAIGNLVDRVRLGYVVDFISVGRWPVFNVADSAIVVGAFFLAVTTIRSELK